MAFYAACSSICIDRNGLIEKDKPLPCLFTLSTAGRQRLQRKRIDPILEDFYENETI